MIYIEMSDSTMMDYLISDDYAKWSYEQAQAIIDYLNERHYDNDDTEGDLSFSAGAIRSEWSSFKDDKEVLKAHNLPLGDDLSEYTTVLRCDDNTIVVMEF